MSTSDSHTEVVAPLSGQAPFAPTSREASRISPPALPRRRPRPRVESDQSLVADAPPVDVGSVVPPPIDSVAETPEHDDLRRERGGPRRVGGWLWSMPSWLVSVIAHLLAFLVLALIPVGSDWVAPERLLLTIDPEPDLSPPVMTSAVRIDVSLDLLKVADAGFDADELSSAAFGESLAHLPRPDGGELLEGAEATLQDVGVLFGARGQGLARTDTSGQGAEFFGLKAGGRKFVFIVDSSNSMQRGKFDAARAELEYAIRRLDRNQFFYIIFFDQNAERLTLAPNTEPEERAVAANVGNIQRAEKWMAGIKHELRTDPFEAVRYAVEMLPDAIYILSDGKFTDKGRTEKYLARNNRLDDPVDGPRPKVVIHTIGFYSRAGEETLERIAKEYGGTYRFVPAPPGFKGK